MRNSLANWIRVAVASLCGVLIGATIWQGSVDEREKRRDLDVATMNLARSLVQYSEDTMAIAHSAIAGIAEDASRSAWTPEFRDKLHRRMATQVAASDRLKALFLYDADGNWIASSLDRVPAGANNSDRVYFRHHRTLKSDAPFVAPPVLSRSSGEWIVTLTMRLNNPDGSFGGVVLASVEAAHFSHFFEQFDVGARGRIMLLNDRGIVLSSRSEQARLIGTDRSEDVPFRTPAGHPSTWVSHFTSMLDASERIAGTRRGARYGLHVIASLSVEEALSSERSSFQIQLLLVLLFCLAVCVAGFQIARQVRERRRAENQLRVLSETDVLTGLANRRSLQFRLAEWCRSGDPFELLLIDLDRFKIVNDTHGHATGDHLLVMVAERLRAAVRRQDFIARLGGDEMAVIVPGRIEDALAIARRIADAIEQPFALDAIVLDIGCSIGLSGSAEADDATQRLQHADLALYEAKHRGRGRIVTYQAGMMEARVEHHRLESDLRHALEGGQFHLVYQPILCLTANKRIGAEALLRWTHPTLGPISPASFIPLAEESGRIVEIGRWVLEEACRAAVSWPDDIYVAVNVSPTQFRAPLFFAHVASALMKSGLPSHRLEIELTETAMAGDVEEIAGIIAMLRSHGIRIAMDDFGTGFSSLSRLRDLPLDRIKIDRSFVAAAETDTYCRAVIAAVVQLGRTLEIGVLAEGIETQSQFDLVSALGCHAGQGYLFGRPSADAMAGGSSLSVVARAQVLAATFTGC